MLCGMLLDNKIIKMNNIVNKFLLAGDKCMPEMHLRQPRIVYNACGPFTRHKERIKEFKRTGDTRLLYRNELDNACFKHDAAYAKYKDQNISDQKLRNSAYDIASNPKYDGYQRGLANMVYKFFGSNVAPLDKKTMSGKGNKILAEELHKPVIKKINKRKVYSQFRDIIVFLKNAYQTMLLLCILLLMKKKVVAERFLKNRTLKNESYKHMTATDKNVYYDVLDDVVNEYNNTKHNAIKMKPKDVKNGTAELSSLERNKRVYIDKYNKKC